MSVLPREVRCTSSSSRTARSGAAHLVRGRVRARVRARAGVRGRVRARFKG